MKQITAAIILIGLWGCSSQPEVPEKFSIVTEVSERTTKFTPTEIALLDSLNIDFQLRGNCYAYSSDKNSQKSGGEAHSSNLPKQVDKTFPRQGLYLVINQNELTSIDSTILACKLYLVNSTDQLIKLEASDSRLYIVAEVRNERNGWSPITYLPSSFCGNSYHTVVLDKDEYWEFDIPVFKGNIKTKLRYTLTIDKDKKISSNEIVAYINKGQLESENKQGHRRTGIMDPYDE